MLATASAGNHGQAIALAAKTLGLAARVYLPASAPAAKRDAMRRLGAEMIETSDYDAAETAAHQAGLDDDAAFVSAYSHRDVIRWIPGIFVCNSCQSCEKGNGRSPGVW